MTTYDGFGAPIYRAFDEAKHVRGTGEQGGQFVAAGTAKTTQSKQAAARKPGGKRPSSKAAAGAGNLSFDGKRGTGYGVKGGDKRVRGLQAALNKLGLTDANGKPLAVDGKLGPKTTAAIKKAQRALGVKADGVVTPALLAKIKASKSLGKKAPAKKAAAPAAKKAAPARPRKTTRARKTSKAPAKKAAPVNSGAASKRAASVRKAYAT